MNKKFLELILTLLLFTCIEIIFDNHLSWFYSYEIVPMADLIHEIDHSTSTES